MMQSTRGSTAWLATGVLLVGVALVPAAAVGMPAADGGANGAVRLDVSGTHVFVEAPMTFERVDVDVSRRGEADVWTATLDRGSNFSLDIAEIVGGALSDGRYDYQLNLTLPDGGDSAAGGARYSLAGVFEIKGGSIERLYFPGQHGAQSTMAAPSGDPEAASRGDDAFVSGHLRVGGWGCYGCASGTAITDGKVQIFDGGTGLGAGTTYTPNSGSQWTVGTNAGDFAIIRGKTTVVGFADGAPANSLRIASSGAIGFGTASPDADVHVRDVTGTGAAVIKLHNSAGLGSWNIAQTPTGVMTFNKVGTPQEFTVREANHSVATLDVAGHVRGTSFISTSSRSVKTAFEAIDPMEILGQIAALPVTAWRYKTEGDGKRHIGPVAEDFQRLFGLGDGRTIAGIDADGVLMAAIQGLKQLVDETRTVVAAKDAEITELRAELEAIKEAIAEP